MCWGNERSSGLLQIVLWTYGRLSAMLIANINFQCTTKKRANSPSAGAESPKRPRSLLCETLHLDGHRLQRRRLRLRRSKLPHQEKTRHQRLRRRSRNANFQLPRNAMQQRNRNHSGEVSVSQTKTRRISRLHRTNQPTPNHMGTRNSHLPISNHDPSRSKRSEGKRKMVWKRRRLCVSHYHLPILRSSGATRSCAREALRLGKDGVVQV